MDPMMLAMMAGPALSAIGGSMAQGNKGKFEQLTTQSPEQRNQFLNFMSQLQGPQAAGMENLMGLLSNDQAAFDKYEQPFKRQFMEETVPALSERFAGLGSHGGLSSSGFQQTAARAGERLSENLASMRGQLQMQAMNQLSQLMGQAQRPTFENVYQQPQAGFAPYALGGAGSGLSQFALMSMMPKFGGQ